MINSNQVIIKSYDKLTKTEMYAILALRIKVFCVEQECPYQDLDYKDQEATHVFMLEKNTIIAYARIIQSNKKDYHIGRVVVDEQYRKFGLATIVMQKCIKHIKINKSAHIIISAQSYLKDFYKKFGFKNSGQYYLEDNIPHEQMELTS